jgi:hypothetical protein
MTATSSTAHLVLAAGSGRSEGGVPARLVTLRFHHAVTIGTQIAVTTTLVATSTVAVAAAGL